MNKIESIDDNEVELDMKSKLSLPDSVGCCPTVPPPPPLLFESPVLPPLPSEKKMYLEFMHIPCATPQRKIRQY